MKKEPDQTTLTQWIDGELVGEELQRVEAWAQNHPELLAERDAIRVMNQSIRATIPASIEPPYGDFFNERILRHIESEQLTHVPTLAPKRRIWQWLMIPTAAASMALCFYVGTRVAEPTSISSPSNTVVSTIYTPDGDVSADIFRAEGAGATVIVLKGLTDIPDDLEMVGNPATDSSSGASMVSISTSY